jgi:hypothetical protein
MIEKKQAALLSLASSPVVLSWGNAKQDFSSVRIAVWFQHHNCKPMSRHQ